MDFQTIIKKITTFETAEKYPSLEIQAEVIPVEGGNAVQLKFTEMLANLQGMDAEQVKVYLTEQVKAYYRLQASVAEVDPVTEEWVLTPDIQGAVLPFSL